MKRILRYLHRKQFDRELTVEMQAHLNEKIDDLMVEGLEPEEARIRALRQFGNRTLIAETSSEQWSFVPLDEIGQDLRYAARVLRKTPIFTIVAVVSLALGIGANTIIFSAVNHVLLRSIPYPRSEQLFAVWSRSASRGVEPMHVSAADFYDWQAQSHAFESLAAYASWPMNLTNIDEPRRLETELVSVNLFSTLGIHAQIGRTFLPEEEQQSSSVVILSDHLWRALGESPSIVGQELTLNGSQAIVIGVMPADFTFPSRQTDAWVPLSLSAQNRSNREGRWLKVIGRLRANAQRSDAAAEMNVIASRLATAYPKTNTGWSVSVIPLQEELVGRTRPILLMFQVIALLLLLITCANLANLLLAKGSIRTREIGVRTALGAGRARILRQFMVESTVLAALGGSFGFALAVQGITLVRIFGTGLISRADEIHLSGPVALFTVAATLVTILLFGLLPALQASRIDLRASISSGFRSTSRYAERLRGLLVTMEIGMASVLLVAAGLLSGSLVHLLSTPTGLQTEHVLTLQITLGRSKYPTNTAQNVFFQQVLDRVQRLPGVLAAGEVSDTPLKGNNPTFELALEGVTRSPSDAPIQAALRLISTGYLRAVGISLFKGRDFVVSDYAGSLPVAIINQTMARRYWPGIDPVGRRLHLKEDQRWMTIVGVVADIKHMGLKADEGPVIYIPYAQKTQDWLAWITLLVRTTGEPIDWVPALRRVVRTIDKNQPIGEIGTLKGLLAHSTAMPRFNTFVICTVSGFALLLALIGVYGLLAYTVAQRLPELGIRITLGASPLEVSWLLLRQAMLRVLTGMTAGLLIAWWSARLMESLLFGVRAHEPTAFVGVAGLMILAALAAVLVPARRAMKIDPAAALRME